MTGHFFRRLFGIKRTPLLLVYLLLIAPVTTSRLSLAGDFRYPQMATGEEPTCESNLARGWRITRGAVAGIAATAWKYKKTSAFLGVLTLGAINIGGIEARQWNRERVGENHTLASVATEGGIPETQAQTLIRSLLLFRTPRTEGSTFQGRAYPGYLAEPSTNGSGVVDIFTRSEIGLSVSIFNPQGNPDWSSLKTQAFNSVRLLSYAQVMALIQSLHAAETTAYIYNQNRALFEQYGATPPHYLETRPSLLTQTDIENRMRSTKREMTKLLAFLFVATHPDTTLAQLLDLERVAGFEAFPDTHPGRYDEGPQPNDIPRYLLRFTRVLAREGNASLSTSDVLTLMEEPNLDKNSNHTGEYSGYNWAHGILREYLRGQLSNDRITDEQIRAHLFLISSLRENPFKSVLLLAYVDRLLNSYARQLSPTSIVLIYIALENLNRFVSNPAETVDIGHFRMDSATKPLNPAQAIERIALAQPRLWQVYFNALHSPIPPPAPLAPGEARARFFDEVSQDRTLEWWQTHLDELAQTDVALPEYLHLALVHALTRNLRSLPFSRLTAALPHLSEELRRSVLATYFTAHESLPPSHHLSHATKLIAGQRNPTVRLALAETFVELGYLRRSSDLLTLSRIEGVGVDFYIYVMEHYPNVIRSRRSVDEISQVLLNQGPSMARPTLKMLTRSWSRREVRRFFPVALMALRILLEGAPATDDPDIVAFLTAFRVGTNARQRAQLSQVLGTSSAAYYRIIFRP